MVIRYNQSTVDLRVLCLLQCHEAKTHEEKIEILNYDTSIHGESTAEIALLLGA